MTRRLINERMDFSLLRPVVGRDLRVEDRLEAAEGPLSAIDRP
jgi:hypothetical protein